MKPISLLLLVSLVANVALVTWFSTRPPASASKVAANRSTDRPSANLASARTDSALLAALASGDLAALQAAGVAPEVARDLALGRSLARITEKMKAARSTSGRWWRSREAGHLPREQFLQFQREISDAMVAAFGEDLISGQANAKLLAFLPAEKRDALRRINQDYDEMMAKFSAGGIQLPSDRERLRLLRAERDRDIAALLTPEELLDYEMRTSPTAGGVRARFGDAIETEEDFRKIYALQKAFDQQYPLDGSAGRMTPEMMRQRSEAQRQLQDNLRTALGEEKYAALRRASDSDLKNVEALVSRLNLPATSTDRIAAARESYAAESQRIQADASLDPQQRRTQIQELANRARTELTGTLGTEAATAYAQHSPWMNMLQGGMAYTTSPAPGSPGSLFGPTQGVFPVMPAGAAGTVGRQAMMFNAAPAFEAAASDVAIGAGNVRVMTFSAGAVSSDDPAAGAVIQRKETIVVPAQPAIPLQPPPR